ncbi:MAG: thrombospondin type 3 repeat-containing protein, partial [Candidatus Eisenbacteria bacterium]
MHFPNLIHGRAPLAVVVLATVALLAGLPGVSGAALSQTAGTGVWDVQSAESKRPGRLELGIFATHRGLALGDSANTWLNALDAGANAGLGLPGGFELSGTLPIHAYYLSGNSSSTPFGKEMKVRLGDVAARARWTTPFLVPGSRVGIEGEATFATGDGATITYPGRSPVQPFTVGQNRFTARGMFTWDGLRAGAHVPLRLHANTGYTNAEGNRWLVPASPLDLELPAPTGSTENNYLTIGAGAELDLPRFTLSTDFVTHQFVNQRSTIREKENAMTLTPGIRFWLPGGLSLGGAYSMSLSKDSPETAFNPKRAFPDHEWRVALSLGTIYRGTRARAEDHSMAAAQAITAPVDVSTPESAAVATDEAKKAKILARRDVQEASAKESLVQGPTAPAPMSVPVAAARPAPVVAPKAAAMATPTAGPFADRDGDRIPDEVDLCPLAPEDWDGFEDFDGCPDLDNDQDGIPDDRDMCPNAPETFNGFYDFDGCPDELPGAPRPSPALIPAAPAVPTAPSAPNSQVTPDLRMRAMADSLRMAVEVAKEQARVADARLARSEAERRDLTQRISAAMTVPAAPAPVAAPSPATAAVQLEASRQAMELQNERERSKRLADRIADLEDRQMDVLREQARTPAQQPGGNVTVLPGGTSPVNTDQAVRIATLESELRRLQNEVNRPAPMAAALPMTPVETPEQRAMRERLANLEGQLEQMRSAAAASQQAAAAEASPAGSNAEDWRSLDLVLPPGAARVFPEIQFESGSAHLTAPARQQVA